MKIKIFLDSNQVTSKAPVVDVFNKNIQDLSDFLKEKKISNIAICLPEIVIREKIQHKLEQIEESISVVNRNLSFLRKFDYKDTNISIKQDIKGQLEKQVQDFIKKFNILKVPITKISKKDLVERAIIKMKPFDDNASGFKDTLIFLSIVEDALKKNSADKYIFCTNDHGFDDDVSKQFKDITKKDLILLKSIELVKQKLDEIIPLGLHLEERNNKIKQLILSHSGDIMFEINKQMDYERRNESLYLNNYLRTKVTLTSWPQMVPFGSDKGENIYGFNLMDINIENILDMAENIYTVKLDVMVEGVIKGKNTQNDLYIDSVLASFDMFSNRMEKKNLYLKFKILVDCDVNNSMVIVKNVDYLG